MKLLIIMSVLAFSTLATAQSTLKGSITLKGKVLPVSVDTREIVIGKEVFKTIGYGTQFEGSLRVDTNGKITTDKNVAVILDKATIKEIKKDLASLRLSNAKEVKCTAESNAFIMIGDNLSDGMIANCLKLK